MTAVILPCGTSILILGNPSPWKYHLDPLILPPVQPASPIALRKSAKVTVPDSSALLWLGQRRAKIFKDVLETHAESHNAFVSYDWNVDRIDAIPSFYEVDKSSRFVVPQYSDAVVMERHHSPSCLK